MFLAAGHELSHLFLSTQVYPPLSKGKLGIGPLQQVGAVRVHSQGSADVELKYCRLKFLRSSVNCWCGQRQRK